ncbi:PHB depolymerase family esterase [Rhizobium sp. WW_1]|uniref:PHB depolymerase family esterase n=1 Tax=unclassified Rhizobium TaxID=2613769 RepID=UPI0032AF8E62
MRPAFYRVAGSLRVVIEARNGSRFHPALSGDAHSNNPQRCFNWFRLSAVARDSRELLSIKQMVDHTLKRYRADRGRVYIVGLSAGEP